jgi:hypothetical protein
MLQHLPRVKFRFLSTIIVTNLVVNGFSFKGRGSSSMMTLAGSMTGFRGPLGVITVVGDIPVHAIREVDS